LRQQARAEGEEKARHKNLIAKEKSLHHAQQMLARGRLPRPAHWTPSTGRAYADGVLTLIPVQDKSVLACLEEHLEGTDIDVGGADQQQSGRYSRLKLKRAWRVENGDLLGQYKVAQCKVLSVVASHRVPLTGKNKVLIRPQLYASSQKLEWTMEKGCNEVRLLHGTKPDLLLGILQHAMARVR
jgi:hypothetical protein